MLTDGNLFDGTITTNLEDYYIEPSHKYSTKLSGNGVHSIVYKSSDVKFLTKQQRRPSVSSGTSPSSSSSGTATAATTADNKHATDDGDDDDDADAEHYCASERLRKKFKNEFKRRRKLVNDNDNFISDRSFNEFVKSSAAPAATAKRRNKRFLPDEVSIRIFYFYVCFFFLCRRAMMPKFFYIFFNAKNSI